MWAYSDIIAPPSMSRATPKTIVAMDTSIRGAMPASPKMARTIVTTPPTASTKPP